VIFNKTASSSTLPESSSGQVLPRRRGLKVLSSGEDLGEASKTKENSYVFKNPVVRSGL
jgi:hypothetical protein